MSMKAAMEILGHRGEVAEATYVLRTGSVTRILGDRVRSRLCMFDSADGESWCLRPDLTSPILIGMAESGSGVSDRVDFHYHDRAFRVSADSVGVEEFSQAGFEWFTPASGEVADVEAIETMVEAVRAMSVRETGLRLGDAGLWNRLIDVVEMDAVWRRRFRRAWLGGRDVRAMVRGASVQPERSALARTLASVGPEQAASAVEDILMLGGAGVSGRRRAADIAFSLVEAGHVAPLAQSSCDVLLGYLDIEGKAYRSADEIGAMTRSAGLDLSEALHSYVTRLDRLSERIGLSEASHWEFGAQFGRSFDYYDGMVFEVTHAGLPATRALARGGRYDGVLERLGLATMPALGAALRPDRVAMAAGG